MINNFRTGRNFPNNLITTRYKLPAEYAYDSVYFFANVIDIRSNESKQSSDNKRRRSFMSRFIVPTKVFYVKTFIHHSTI